MLYRRSPLRPPKLLLRAVATAGVGTLVGVAACSSSTSNGSVANAPSDTSDASDQDAPFLGCEGVCGFVLDRDACTVENGCETLGVSPAIPRDAGEPHDAGPLADADAGPTTDATDGSGGDGSTEAGPCNPVCGIIVHPDE
jgi:hypothetical protein